tara:strand:+ start:518 stop:1291 length:774 start_codon:yes stop_codon:yes gene_type:complete
MAEKQEEAKHKFPTEVIDLPSKGLLYPEESPLSSGKLEMKYMTAKEEDILTSQNLIKKGVVMDKLLSALIVNKDISVDDLIVGDKNAIMVAARILAYGPEYTVELTNQYTDEKFEHTFNLVDCAFKETPDDVDYSGGTLSTELPVSKTKVEFKFLTGKHEKIIEREIKARKKIGHESPEVTTRLKHTIVSIDGDTSAGTINSFVDNQLLSRDSLFLRTKIQEYAPDIDMTEEVEMEGQMVKVNIPLTIEFFWPKTAG